MRVLELFACAGGASRGLVAADNEVIATDINQAYLDKNPIGTYRGLDTQPQGGLGAPVRLPWEWVFGNKGSRTECLDWNVALERYADQVDWVWASPPCQVYSVTKGLRTLEYEGLIASVRERLLDLGKPYVIENVEGAREEMKNPITLCGCMFYGLRVFRPRLFESDQPLVELPHAPHRQKAGDMGRPARHGERVQCAGNNSNADITADAMGYDTQLDRVATTRLVSESIPPHFAYYIAREMERLLDPMIVRGYPCRP